MRRTEFNKNYFGILSSLIVQGLCIRQFVFGSCSKTVRLYPVLIGFRNLILSANIRLHSIVTITIFVI